MSSDPKTKPTDAKPKVASASSAKSGGFAGVKPPKAPQDRILGSEASSRLWHAANQSGRWMALVLVVIVIILLVTTNIFPVRHHYQVGQVAERDIRAQITFSMIDTVQLQQKLNELKTNGKHYYKYIPTMRQEARKQEEALFQKAQALAVGDQPATATEKVALLSEWASEKQHVRLEGALAFEILSLTKDREFLPVLDDTLGYVYLRGVVDDLSVYRAIHAKNQVEFEKKPPFSDNPHSMLDKSRLTIFLESQFASGGDLESAVAPQYRNLVARLTQLYVRPNVVHQDERTEQAMERERARLENNPPVLTVEKGDLLVRKYENITRDKLDQIAAMTETSRKTLYLQLLSSAAYAVLLCGLMMQYMRNFRKDVTFTSENVFLVALPVLIALALGRLSLELVNYPKLPEAARYLFPAGLIGMLTVILLDARTAILLVTVGSLTFSLATELDFKVFLTSLLGGYAAVGTLTGAKERKEVLRAGLVVGGVNALIILLVGFIDDPNNPKMMLMVWGLANGIVCGVLSMPALVLFETMPNVVTDIRLLELTGLDHPLVKLMEEKAPGSYQHSLNVCKLAEAAARDIGANYLLVRAGSYFHDVGKIVKPKYFSENQISLEDKSLHGKISPYMSAMIIKNHVKAGIELAHQYHLPSKVLDFIPQHQGTTLISFFYHQAQKRFENSQSTDPVREIDFRYPGPKPQSIETAIVMLADAVEATVTSRFTSLTVNEYELSATVKKTVADKFNDGQFDDCDLTLRDLHLIRESFVKTLLARFHQRVAYPGQTTPVPVPATLPRRDRPAA